MTNQRILITGGAGFIGTHLAKALKDKNQVTIIDFKKGNLKGVKYITKSYSNSSLLNQLLGQTDIVYHLAWNSTPAVSQSMKAEEKNNIKPSKVLIKLSKKQNIKHFIFMSSAGAVYGNIKTPFKEIQAPKPINNYGRAKLKVEDILKTQADENFKTTVIRATNVIGQTQVLRLNQGVIPAVIKALKQNKTFILWGNSQKDYLAINDLIKALILTPQQKTPFEVFNVGSDKVLSVTDIIHLIESATGRKLKLKQVSAQKHDVSRVKVDTEKIKAQLGWHLTIKVKPLIRQISLKNL